MTRNLLIAAAFVLAFPGTLNAQLFSAGDVDFTLTESLYADWHNDKAYGNGEGAYDYFDMKSRLNLEADSPWLQAGLRLDAAGFLGPESGAAGEAFDSDFDHDVTVEKIFFRTRFQRVTLEVGDVYGCLGKGVALCIKKMDELSTDTTLRGLKLTFQQKEVGVTFLGGLANVVNVGDKVEEFLPDPNDVVAGAEVRVTPVSSLRLSAHGSVLVDERDLSIPDVPVLIHAPEEQEPLSARRSILSVVGPGLAVSNLPVLGNLMAEYDAMLQTFEPLGDEPTPDLFVGQAVYGSWTRGFGIVHLLLEAKWYDSRLPESESQTNFMGTKVIGPSGESDFVYYGVLPPIDDEHLFVRNDRPYDVAGGRLRVDVEVAPLSGVAFASYTHFVDVTTGNDAMGDYFVRHGTAGWEQRLDSLSIVGNLAGGYRQEDFHFTRENMWHLGADVQFPLVASHSLQLQGRMENYDRPDEGTEYIIAQASTTYAFAPWLALVFNYEHSDQPGPHEKGDFYSGEAIFRFMSGSYFKLFGGSSRGGLKCAGGMCRTFPPFEGVKGELTLRF